jgi:hypothetical protein
VTVNEETAEESPVRRSTRQAMVRMANAPAGRAGDAGVVDLRVGGDEQAIDCGGHAQLSGRTGPMIPSPVAVG